MGVRDEPLGVLFLLISSPVAAASFVMVVAARGDGVLAEVKTEIAINRAFYEKCADAYAEGKLSAEDAAMLKYASTEMQCKTIDEALQALRDKLKGGNA